MLRGRIRLYLVASFLLCFLFPVCPVVGQTSVRLLAVNDGDTVTVLYKGRKERVRLIGIDAPELHQEYGQEAKAFVESFLEGKSLQLKLGRQSRDKYKRLLAYIYADDCFLNSAIVENGLALAIYIKPNGRQYGLLKKKEKQARREKRGFWKAGGLTLSPYQWRKKHPRRPSS